MLSASGVPIRFKPASNNPTALPTLFYVGVGLYLFSFFLPAVQLFGGPHGIPGWMCAWYSLWPWDNTGNISRLAIFGGLINPLAVLYIYLRIKNRDPRFRTLIAVTIVIFILPTWTAMSRMNLGVFVGHMAWIASLALILLPGNQRWPEARDLIWPAVAAIVLTGWKVHIERSKQMIQEPTQRDLFYFDVGVDFLAPDACARINPYAEGHSEGQPGFQVRYLQSECYYFFSRAMMTPSLCKYVRPVSIGMKDGSKFTPQFCKNQILKPGTIEISGAQKELVDNTPLPPPTHPIFQTSTEVWVSDLSAGERKNMMQAAGYGDEQVREFLRLENPNRLLDDNYRPTYDEYSAYFYRIAVSYQSPVRTEFVRRLLAVP